MSKEVQHEARVPTNERRATAGCDPWYIPGKPGGMHWDTYERLQADLLREIGRRDALFGARVADLAAEVDQLPAQREYLRG